MIKLKCEIALQFLILFIFQFLIFFLLFEPVNIHVLSNICCCSEVSPPSSIFYRFHVARHT